SIIVLTPTGIAASNIDGYTIYSACEFGIEGTCNNNNLTGDTLNKLQDFWNKIQCVIIDKVSMIRQYLLARFHIFLKVVKSSDISAPFARLNILFSDDFMQLLLVLDPALYMPSKVSNINLSEEFKAANDIELNSNFKKCKHALYKPLINNRSVMNAIGRNLWLNHQREALRSRIINDNRIKNNEWKNATFLVTRNDLLSDTKENALAGILPLTVRMTVILTVNICICDGLANSSKGIIKQININKDSIESFSLEEKLIILKRPSTYVVIEPIDL
ncbi:7287_t:CDS:2, partial [Scutellospora calospora]